VRVRVGIVEVELEGVRDQGEREWLGIRDRDDRE
jgi:hypothetical protein